MQVFREVMDEARPGDNVGIQIENYTLKDIRKGDVCGDTCDDPPQAVTQFTAQVYLHSLLNRLFSNILTPSYLTMRLLTVRINVHVVNLHNNRHQITKML